MRLGVHVLVLIAACRSPAPPATAPPPPAVVAAVSPAPFATDPDFDHAATGWPLERAHRALACERCHGARTSSARPPFTGLERACDACHASPHAGSPFAVPPCTWCHRATTFRDLVFDHGERTRVDLGASHRRLACAACHTAALGAGPPPAACAPCHANRDPHAGRFAGLGCERCHAPSKPFTPGGPRPSWTASRFDHGAHPSAGARARFHDRLGCRSCHRGTGPTTFERVPPGASCTGCHAHRSVHASATHPTGQFTNAQCLHCHMR